MKTILIAILSLFLSNNLMAQLEIVSYDYPFLEYKKLESSSNINLAKYTKVDLSKLDYNIDSKDGRLYVDLPFHVNDIPEKSDFLFSMIQGTTWGIFKDDKTGIVKTFNRMKNNEGKTYGVYQRNKDLTEPIQKGKYYIRLFVEQRPKKKKLIYIYLGNIQE